MTLENLIGKGLQREPTSAEEIRRFLGKISTKLTDAGKDSISLDSRFDLAYEALLQIGLAALRANSLRPDSRGGHHVLARPHRIRWPTLSQSNTSPYHQRRLSIFNPGT